MCKIRAISKQFFFTYPLEILHLTEYFYTTSGCDGCDKYEVCVFIVATSTSFDADMNTHMSEFPIMDDSAIVILHNTVGYLGWSYIVGSLSPAGPVTLPIGLR